MTKIILKYLFYIDKRRISKRTTYSKKNKMQELSKKLKKIIYKNIEQYFKKSTI